MAAAAASFDRHGGRGLLQGECTGLARAPLPAERVLRHGYAAYIIIIITKKEKERRDGSQSDDSSKSGFDEELLENFWKNGDEG